MSSVSRYETPLYDLPIDAGINEELLATGEFEVVFWVQSLGVLQGGSPKYQINVKFVQGGTKTSHSL